MMKNPRHHLDMDLDIFDPSMTFRYYTVGPRSIEFIEPVIRWPV